MRGVIQVRRPTIAAALRYSLIGAYLAVVAFVSLSALGWQARAVETSVALLPAVSLVIGMLLWRFVRHVRELEAEQRKRPLWATAVILLVVLVSLGGIWIYLESRPPPPVVEGIPF